MNQSKDQQEKFEFLCERVIDFCYTNSEDEQKINHAVEASIFEIFELLNAELNSIEQLGFFISKQNRENRGVAELAPVTEQIEKVMLERTRFRGSTLKGREKAKCMRILLKNYGVGIAINQCIEDFDIFLDSVVLLEVSFDDAARVIYKNFNFIFNK